MRFIHTADWQIGKVFKQFGSKEETLRQARLAVIERLGALAHLHGASHILVAGDIYDKTIRLENMVGNKIADLLRIIDHQNAFSRGRFLDVIR